MKDEKTGIQRSLSVRPSLRQAGCLSAFTARPRSLARVLTLMPVVIVAGQERIVNYACASPWQKLRRSGGVPHRSFSGNWLMDLRRALACLEGLCGAQLKMDAWAHGRRQGDCIDVLTLCTARLGGD